jgi:hypothetical protein
MNGKCIAALVVGIALGVAASSSGLVPGAAGQVQVRGPNLQQWEYKVVFSSIAGTGEKDSERFTNEFDRLAADRWEYVGPVLDRTSTGLNGAYSGINGVYVLFKRPK